MALLDLVLPYVLRGENLGGFHALVSALRVTTYEQASDGLGVTIRGRGEFNGWLRLFPNGQFSASGGVDEAVPAYDPNNRQPVFDLAETAIQFELLIPRVRSDIVAAGEASLGAPLGAVGAATQVLDQLVPPAGSPRPTDYPATGFTLDLILDAPSLRPPFLQPAKLASTGLLAPDPSVKEVTLTLPKLRFRASHGNAVNSVLRFDLVSLGATGLDDPSDVGVAQLVSMDPPYAYFGGPGSDLFGIGFRSATLDLSADSTPPALKDKAGVGDDWTGLYLPEARAFFSPNGLRNMAFEVGAHEFMLGMGHDSAGIWGDFEALVVDQGDNLPTLAPRFVDEGNVLHGVARTSATTATVQLPAKTRLVVDVTGGRMPYTRSVRVGSAAAQNGTVFTVDLTATPTVDIAITVTDSSPVPKTVNLTISAQRVTPLKQLPTPAPAVPAANPATAASPAGAVHVVVDSQTDTVVVLTTVPPDPATRWTVDADPETGPSTSISVPVAPGATHSVQARRPGSAATQTDVPFHFFFDRPPRKVDNPPDPPDPVDPRNPSVRRAYSLQRALSKLSFDFEPPNDNPLVSFHDAFAAMPNGPLTVTGHASFEGIDDSWHREHNCVLAGHRAQKAALEIESAFPGKFDIVATPSPQPTKAQIDAWVTATGWTSHGAPNDRDFWCATTRLEVAAVAEKLGTVTLNRPALAPPPPPPVLPVVPTDPTPKEPSPPDWFRSAKASVRVVKSDIIAAELDVQLFLDAFVEQSLKAANVNASTSPSRTLQQGQPLPPGTPVGPDNPTDGITNFRVLAQTDPSTGRVQVLGSIGADPADTSGLLVWGWMPGEPVAPREPARNLVGSYLTFWPLLAALPLDAAVHRAKDENKLAAIADVGLAGAVLAIPAGIAALPFLQVERVVWYGGEVLVGQRSAGGEFDASILADVGIAWSTPSPLLGILSISQQSPLVVRYKAIGVHTANHDADGAAAFKLHPVFDASRGYTIDVQGSGTLKIRDPLGQILKILAARLSRTNPLTLEIDIGMSVDLGVVTVERAAVRVYLDDPTRLPELTALGVHVDIAGALVGSGFMQIGHANDPVTGAEISTIGGQLDLTLRPINLRVAAAVEIAQIPAGAGGPATGVYVGLDVVLPVGIPLGTSGLGIFGFRGLFGMHYERNPAIGQGAPAPALTWLDAADGQPNYLVNPKHPEIKLWTPHVDHWAFGLGMLIGTMEGGFILNLDGTLILELPGPRVLIVMNARILSLPPGLDEVGGAGGVLAVIEITPDHFLVGVLIKWEIPDLIKINIPIAAMFPFGSDSGKWYVYLGARPDYGQPVEVDVLGIVKGTGYVMARGDGLMKYHGAHGDPLPALQGFALGLGVGATFTWGDTDIGLYLRIGGGMDAELGFQPFTLAGTIWVAGELRLFIISIGADAALSVLVAEHDGSFGLHIHGEACGHVSFLFFTVSGCVDITLDVGDSTEPAVPDLVGKVSLQSRSPALVAGTGVDRGIDTSLGDAWRGDGLPPGNAKLPVVPIDAIPIIAMVVPPAVAPGVHIGGLGVALGSAPGAPNVASPDTKASYTEHGADRYQYVISAVALERVNPANGQPAGAALAGTNAPAVWWTLGGPTEPSPLAQLALLTWSPSASTKAIEKTDRLTSSLVERWKTLCAPSAAPAEVLWTFRWEPVGFSATGWDLDGIAWPDDAGTVRSTAVDTTVHVGERWRSGDTALDAMRGIFPAFVLGGTVECDHPRRVDPGLLHRLGIDDPHTLLDRLVPRLVVGGAGPVTRTPSSGSAVAESDPVHHALVHELMEVPVRISPALHAKVTAATRADQPQPAVELAHALKAGLPLDVAALQSALTPVVTVGERHQRPGRRRCSVRLLAAPMLDDGRPIAIGDLARQDEVEQRLAQLGVKHGDLDDVVVVRTGGYASFGVLLFVPRGLLEGGHLVVRSLDAADNEHQRVVVDVSNLVGSQSLPPRWIDSRGPWAAQIADLLRWEQTSKTLTVFVALDKDENADRVEIGTYGLPPTRPRFRTEGQEPDQSISPPFFVAALSETSWSEVARSDWDSVQLSNDEQVITQVFGPASGSNALLHADSLYRVSVTSTGRKLAEPQHPQLPPVTQEFWFRTDRMEPDPAEPGQAARLRFSSTRPVPVRLDSWLMMTVPDEAEKAYFGLEHVQLVFNTLDIDRVLAGYGKKMQIRFQAASAQHPISSPGAAHPFPIGPGVLLPVPGTVLSPWEDAMLAALGQLEAPCVPVDGKRSRHSTVDIPIPLNACTDYLMDVELVDLAAGADATGPSVFRRHFSTGLYATFDQFAQSLISPTPSARHVATGAFGAVAAAFAGHRPAGSELDDQLRAHGIEPFDLPSLPRVVVFWEQDGASAPQPAAVMIDAAEPLVRSRRYPRQVTDATGPVPSQRWVLDPREWLQLQDKSAAGVVAANGIVLAPGAQRAFIVLAPHQRGKTLLVDLVAPVFTDLPFLNAIERRNTVVHLTFDRAPWDET